MPASLPPLPEDMDTGGMSAGQPSAFAGGMPQMMQAVQQIEGGAKMLAAQLPSLSPLLAEFVSKLRMAVPSAMSAGAGAPPPAGGQGGLPTPQM